MLNRTPSSKPAPVSHLRRSIKGSRYQAPFTHKVLPGRFKQSIIQNGRPSDDALLTPPNAAEKPDLVKETDVHLAHQIQIVTSRSRAVMLQAQLASPSIKISVHTQQRIRSGHRRWQRKLSSVTHVPTDTSIPGGTHCRGGCGMPRNQSQSGLAYVSPISLDATATCPLSERSAHYPR